MTTGITAKKLLSYGGIIIFVVIIVGYGIWRSRDLLFGINISVAGISDGMTTTESIVSFGGVANHASEITVDGRIVPLAQDGTWTDTISLLAGYNVVTIAAKDKFGRTISNEYRIYYSAPPKAPVAPVITIPAPETNSPTTTPNSTSQPDTPAVQ